MTTTSYAELLQAAFGMSFITGFFIGILGFIVAFGLAVFIHELGHFLAAKAFGVPVERFVIGFDKEAIPIFPGCIFEFRFRETTYGLALIPLGGYVKMSGVVHPDIERYIEGEEAAKGKSPSPTPASATRPDGVAPRPPEQKSNTLQGQAMQDMNALYRKPFWQKIIIYGAGVAMNMVLAMGAITFHFAKGFDQDAPFSTQVGWLAPDNQFAGMGVESGDRLVAIGDAPIADSEDLEEVLSGKLQADDPTALAFPITLEREGEGTVTIEVDLSEDDALLGQFLNTFVLRPAYADYVVINLAADRAGIKEGDLFTVVNGVEILDWNHFVHLVRGSAGTPMEVTVRRAGESIETTLTPHENPEEPGIGQVGVVVGNPEKNFVSEPLLAAMANSPGRVYNFSVRYVQQLGRLGQRAAEGNIAAVRQNLGGPVGIAQMAYRHAQQGFSQWLQFLILLNVALAVMNILPLPVLDGGHICFAIYEAIFRRPVPARVLVPLLNSAVIFILVFFVLVTLNDVLKIFT